MEENETSKKDSIKGILRWIFSIIFVVLSINSAFNKGWLGVALFGSSGLLLCPLVEKQLLKYIPTFPKYIKTIVVSSTIIIVVVAVYLNSLPMEDEDVELTVEETDIVNCVENLTNKFSDIQLEKVEMFNSNLTIYYIFFNYGTSTGIRSSDVAVYYKYSNNNLEYKTSFYTEDKEQAILERAQMMTNYLDEEEKNRVINTLVDTYYKSDKGIEEQDYNSKKALNELDIINLDNLKKKINI